MFQAIYRLAISSQSRNRELTEMDSNLDAMVENTFGTLISVTTKSKNLRQDLKQNICESVSKLRELYNKFLNIVDEKNKRIKDLEKEMSESNTNKPSNLPPQSQHTKNYVKALKAEDKEKESRKYKLFIKTKAN